MEGNVSQVYKLVLAFERDLRRYRPDLTPQLEFSPTHDKVFLYVSDTHRYRDTLELELDLKKGEIFWETEGWKYELNSLVDEDVAVEWFGEQFSELHTRFLVGFLRDDDTEYEYGVCEELGERTAWVDEQSQAEVILKALTDVVTGDWKLVRRSKPGEPELV